MRGSARGLSRPAWPQDVHAKFSTIDHRLARVSRPAEISQIEHIDGAIRRSHLHDQGYVHGLLEVAHVNGVAARKQPECFPTGCYRVPSAMLSL